MLPKVQALYLRCLHLCEEEHHPPHKASDTESRGDEEQSWDTKPGLLLSPGDSYPLDLVAVCITERSGQSIWKGRVAGMLQRRRRNRVGLD